MKSVKIRNIIFASLVAFAAPAQADAIFIQYKNDTGKLLTAISLRTIDSASGDYVDTALTLGPIPPADVDPDAEPNDGQFSVDDTACLGDLFITTDDGMEIVRPKIDLCGLNRIVVE
jgi:hypothetical protein